MYADWALAHCFLFLCSHLHIIISGDGRNASLGGDKREQEHLDKNEWRSKMSNPQETKGIWTEVSRKMRNEVTGKHR